MLIVVQVYSPYRRHSVYVESANVRIRTIKEWIEDREAIPVKKQMIFVDGTSLHPSKTLKYYGIQEGDVLDVHRQQTGMISSFATSDASDPLVALLMSDPENQRMTPRIRKRLQEKMQEEGAKPDASFVYDARCSILKKRHLDLLSEFVDFIWFNNMNDGQVDMKSTISSELLSSLLQHVEREKGAYNIVDRLAELHPSPEDRIEYAHLANAEGPTSKFVFRRTQGPTNACIPFHRDGVYASSTVQIALNSKSEYVGGKLSYFTQDNLRILERPRGSMTRHGTDILHAVTALYSGVRNSFFVVDWTNGLGERGIHEVTEEEVEGFKASKEDEPRSGACVVCFRGRANIALSPCGHVCMCSRCANRVDDRCPKCRARIDSKLEIYL